MDDRYKNIWVLVAGLMASTWIILGCRGPIGGADSTMGQGRLKAARILSAAMVDPDPTVRAAAMEVMAATGQTQMAPAVLGLLRDPLVPVRFATLMALGEIRYRPAMGQVQQVFDQVREDMNVRLAAAYALVRMGANTYIEYPRRMINSTDQTVRANAAMILGRLQDRHCLDALYWALQDRDSDERVITQALEAIAALGDERIYAKLWTRLISAYADDRIAGIRAMGALGTAQAKRALLSALDDEVLEVRLAAAWQLARLGDPSGLDLVLDALDRDLASSVGINLRPNDSAGEVAKIFCCLAAGQIRSRALMGRVVRLMDDPSKLVQLAAARAVLQISPSAGPDVSKWGQWGN